MAAIKPKQSPVVDQRAESVTMIPIGNVHPAPDNPRQELGDLTELRDSIKAQGILQPLVVVASGADGHMVVIGHRRLAAAAELDLAWVPCIVRKYDDQGRVEAMLVENLQRVDLSPLDEARAFKKLTDPPHNLSQRQLADRVGRSQAHVSKRLALVDLPEPALPYLTSGHLTLEDAIVVAKIEDGELSLQVLESLKQHAKEGYRFDAGRQLPALRQKLQTERKRTATEAKLKADKVSILKDEPGYGATSVMPLGTGYHCLPMKASEHAKHPCHAAWIDRWSGEARYYCTKPGNHAATEDKKVAAAVKSLTSNRSYSADGADEAKKKAAATRQRNKALRALAPARAEVLKGLLAGKPKKEQVLDFVLLQLLQRTLDESGGPGHLAATWLGIPETRGEGRRAWSGYLNAGDDAGFSERLLKLAYAVSLAMGEEPLRMLPDRGHFDSTYLVSCQRLYAHLTALSGYRPEKVETDQLKQANHYSWRPPIEGDPAKSSKPRPIKGDQAPLPIADSAGIEKEAGTPAPESPDSGSATASSSGPGWIPEPEPELTEIQRAQAALDAEGPLRVEPVTNTTNGEATDRQADVGDFEDPEPCSACVKLRNGTCRSCGRVVILAESAGAVA